MKNNIVLMNASYSNVRLSHPGFVQRPDTRLLETWSNSEIQERFLSDSDNECVFLQNEIVILANDSSQWKILIRSYKNEKLMYIPESLQGVQEWLPFIHNDELFFLVKKKNDVLVSLNLKKKFDYENQTPAYCEWYNLAFEYGLQTITTNSRGRKKHVFLISPFESEKFVQEFISSNSFDSTTITNILTSLIQKEFFFQKQVRFNLKLIAGRYQKRKTFFSLESFLNSNPTENIIADLDLPHGRFFLHVSTEGSVEEVSDPEMEFYTLPALFMEKRMFSNRKHAIIVGTMKTKTRGSLFNRDWPEFLLYRTISDIFVFKNRLCVATKGSVACSEQGDWRNFFPLCISNDIGIPRFFHGNEALAFLVSEDSIWLFFKTCAMKILEIGGRFEETMRVEFYGTFQKESRPVMTRFGAVFVTKENDSFMVNALDNDSGTLRKIQIPKNFIVGRTTQAGKSCFFSSIHPKDSILHLQEKKYSGDLFLSEWKFPFIILKVGSLNGELRMIVRGSENIEVHSLMPDAEATTTVIPMMLSFRVHTQETLHCLDIEHRGTITARVQFDDRSIELGYTKPIETKSGEFSTRIPLYSKKPFTLEIISSDTKFLLMGINVSGRKFRVVWNVSNMIHEQTKTMKLQERYDQ